MKQVQFVEHLMREILETENKVGMEKHKNTKNHCLSSVVMLVL